MSAPVVGSDGTNMPSLQGSKPTAHAATPIDTTPSSTLSSNGNLDGRDGPTVSQSETFPFSEAKGISCESKSNEEAAAGACQPSNTNEEVHNESNACPPPSSLAVESKSVGAVPTPVPVHSSAMHVAETFENSSAVDPVATVSHTVEVSTKHRTATVPPLTPSTTAATTQEPSLSPTSNELPDADRPATEPATETGSNAAARETTTPSNSRSPFPPVSSTPPEQAPSDSSSPPSILPSTPSLSSTATLIPLLESKPPRSTAEATNTRAEHVERSTVAATETTTVFPTTQSSTTFPSSSLSSSSFSSLPEPVTSPAETGAEPSSPLAPLGVLPKARALSASTPIETSTNPPPPSSAATLATTTTKASTPTTKASTTTTTTLTYPATATSTATATVIPPSVPSTPVIETLAAPRPSPTTNATSSPIPSPHPSPAKTPSAPVTPAKRLSDQHTSTASPMSPVHHLPLRKRWKTQGTPATASAAATTAITPPPSASHPTGTAAAPVLTTSRSPSSIHPKTTLPSSPKRESLALSTSVSSTSKSPVAHTIFAPVPKRPSSHPALKPSPPPPPPASVSFSTTTLAHPALQQHSPPLSSTKPRITSKPTHSLAHPALQQQHSPSLSTTSSRIISKPTHSLAHPALQQHSPPLSSTGSRISKPTHSSYSSAGSLSPSSMVRSSCGALLPMSPGLETDGNGLATNSEMVDTIAETVQAACAADAEGAALLEMGLFPYLPPRRAKLDVYKNQYGKVQASPLGGAVTQSAAGEKRTNTSSPSSHGDGGGGKKRWKAGSGSDSAGGASGGGGGGARKRKQVSGTNSNRKKARRRKAADSSDEESSSQDTRLYCVCRTRYDPSRFMIACDSCDNWYHGMCVGINEKAAKTIDSYCCASCQSGDGDIDIVGDVDMGQPAAAAATMPTKRSNSTSALKKARAKPASKRSNSSSELVGLASGAASTKATTPCLNHKQCGRMATPVSKYCSDPCGLAVAMAKIHAKKKAQQKVHRTKQREEHAAALRRMTTPELRESLRAKGGDLSASDAEDLRRLDELAKRRTEVERSIAELDQTKRDVERAILLSKTLIVGESSPVKKSAAIATAAADRDGEKSTAAAPAAGAGDASNDTVMDCVTCGRPVLTSQFGRHLEKCQVKREGFVPIRSNQGLDKMMCGCPTAEFSSGHCERTKKSCVKHVGWERLREMENAQDLLRLNKMIEDVEEEQKQVKTRVVKRHSQPGNQVLFHKAVVGH